MGPPLPGFFPLHLVAADQQQDEHRKAAGPVDEVVEEVQQPVVLGVGSVDEEHHRGARCQQVEEHPPPREELRCGDHPAVISGDGQPEQSGDSHLDVDPVGWVRRKVDQVCPEDVGHPLGGVVGRHSQTLADHLCHGGEDRPAGVVRALPAMPVDGPGKAVDVALEFTTEAGLANACGPGHDRHRRCPSVDGRGEMRNDCFQLLVPAHEGGLEDIGRMHDPSRDAGSPQLHRPGLAFQLVHAGVLEGERALSRPSGPLIDEQGPGHGGGLHPGGCVHGVARHHPLLRCADHDGDLTCHHPAAGQQGTTVEGTE